MGRAKTTRMDAASDLRRAMRSTDVRVIPATGRTLSVFAVAAAVPLLPLFVFKYPVAGLTRKLFTEQAGQ